MIDFRKQPVPFKALDREGRECRVDCILPQLTLREYYAGQVIQGLWSSDEIIRATTVSTNADPNKLIKEFADIAIQQADALIAALEDES